MTKLIQCVSSYLIHISILSKIDFITHTTRVETLTFVLLGTSFVFK